MSAPLHRRRLRARDLPDLTTDPGPFTAFERHLVAEITRERFHVEPDTTPEPQPSAELFWMGVLAAAFVLVLVLGFLLGSTTSQGLHQ